MLDVDEVASPDYLYYVASQIKAPHDRALFVLEYLSGGRVGEIVKICRKSQFEYRNRNGKTFLAIDRFYTEKNKKHKRRVLVIPVTHEGRLIDLMKEYFDSLGGDDIIFDINRATAWRHIRKIVMSFKQEGKKGEPVIKGMVDGKLRILNKNRKKGDCHMNANHYLRHCRATHLVTKYGYDSIRLQKFMGWTDARPAEIYVHLNVDDLMDKMM